jgi:hypothetical protein
MRPARLEVGLAARGQGQAEVRPVEQRDAELPLERADEQRQTGRGRKAPSMVWIGPPTIGGEAAGVRVSSRFSDSGEQLRPPGAMAAKRPYRWTNYRWTNSSISAAASGFWP